MKTRAALFALLCAACATPVASGVPSELRGCWIERRGEETLTMRWRQLGDTSWIGDMLTYAGDETPIHQTFKLQHALEGAWEICPQDDGMPHGPPCRPARFGLASDLGEGDDWMELTATPDRLRFVYHPGTEELVLFDGARDGCD